MNSRLLGVRLDQFTAGGGKQVRVYARKNATISTQQFMEQRFSGEAFSMKDKDSEFDNTAITYGYMRHNIEPEYNDDEKQTEVSVTTKINDFPLNKSVKTLYFQATVLEANRMSRSPGRSTHPTGN